MGRTSRAHGAARHADDDLRQCERHAAVRRHRYADARRHGRGQQLRQLRLGADAESQVDSRSTARRSPSSSTACRVGNVDYNHFRPDIAATFPGLANSNGAVGFRILDTTTLTERAAHDRRGPSATAANNAEGIGSRYFTVTNGAAASTRGASPPRAGRPTALTRARATPSAGGARRYSAGARAARLESRRALAAVRRRRGAGRAVIRGEEVDRFELRSASTPARRYTGYLRIGDDAGGAAGRLALERDDRHVHLGARRRLRRHLRPGVRAVGRTAARSRGTTCASSSRRRAADTSARRSRSTRRAAQQDVAAAVPARRLGGRSGRRGRHRASTRCTSGPIRWPAARRSSSACRPTEAFGPTSPRVHGDRFRDIGLRPVGAGPAAGHLRSRRLPVEQRDRRLRAPRHRARHRQVALNVECGMGNGEW